MKSGLLLRACIIGVALGGAAARECVNGIDFLEGFGCQCFDCWTGEQCDELASNCTLPTQTNQAYICEEYWLRQPEGSPAVTFPSYFRTGYQPNSVFHPGEESQMTGLGRRLDRVIRELHGQYDNAETEGHSIVMASGGTQLFQAAFYAYSKRLGGLPRDVFTTTPYYYLLPYFANMNPSISTWTPDLNEEDATSETIELLVAPNNPTGEQASARFPGSIVLHDAVFKWPMYTPDYQRDPETQHPVTIFSLSKLTGHSGSRMGWALVNDREIAEDMAEYVYYTTHGLTVDSQSRAATLLEHVVERRGELNDYVAQTLQRRWDRVLDLFSRQTAFEVHSVRDFCLLWVKCVDTPDQCMDAFVSAGIGARDGVEFGQSGHVRINMMVHDVNFEVMMDRLELLLSQKDVPAFVQSRIGTFERLPRTDPRIPPKAGATVRHAADTHSQVPLSY